MLMKASDNKLTPQLRFPEFENSGEWEEKKLGEISSIVKEKLGKNNYTLLSITAGHGLVSQLEKFGKEIAGSSYENYIVIHKNDFAYNKSATKDYQSGYVALLKTYDVAAVPNSIFLCFRIDETILNVFFLEQLFKFNYHDKYLRKLIQIGARAHGSLNISNKDFFSIPIPVPPLKEQKKIAEFLSSVDELLEQEKIKLENLKEYKKGLLQNLFPKENQKVPDLRFPEFKKRGDWEEKKLGDIVEIIQGVAFPVKYQGKKQGDYPFCKVSDISKANEVNGGYLRIALNYIDELEVKILKSKILPKGTTIFAKIGEAIRLNRRAYLEVQALIDNNIAGIKFKNKEYYDLYLFHYTHIIDFNNYISGVIPSLNKSILQQIIIKLPSYKEQQKIADFLSSIDELIIEQVKKIQLLQEYKKGLLQNLFL